MKEAPCYFLEIAPFSFPCISKRGGISAKPHLLLCSSSHLSPPSLLSLLLSLICFVVFQPSFLACALADQTYICPSLFCLRFYICPLALFSPRSVTPPVRSVSVGGQALFGKTPASELMERLLWQQTHTYTQPYPSLFNCTVCLLSFFSLLAIVKPFSCLTTPPLQELFS